MEGCIGAAGTALSGCPKPAPDRLGSGSPCRVRGQGRGRRCAAAPPEVRAFVACPAVGGANCTHSVRRGREWRAKVRSSVLLPPNRITAGSNGPSVSLFAASTALWSQGLGPLSPVRPPAGWQRGGGDYDGAVAVRGSRGTSGAGIGPYEGALARDKEVGPWSGGRDGRTRRRRQVTGGRNRSGTAGEDHFRGWGLFDSRAGDAVRRRRWRQRRAHILGRRCRDRHRN